MKVARLGVVAALAGASVTTMGHASAAGTAPTFAADVAPIVYSNCATCHRPGQAAPFSLLSYDDVKRRATLIVNATSLGHHGQAPDVHTSCYSQHTVAIELAYNPPQTGFMRAASAVGARAENGLGMLVHQAALAFERWTGRDAPLDVYFGAVADRIGV